MIQSSSQAIIIISRKITKQFFLINILLLYTSYIPQYHALSCNNNSTFLHNEEDLKSTCTWIRWNEQRRQTLCQHENTRIQCPISCGVCCADDEEYTFNDDFSSRTVSRDCKWIESSSMKRKEKYCNKHKNGRMVRDACPKSCNFCKTEVIVGVSSNDDTNAMDDDDIVVIVGYDDDDITDDDNHEPPSPNTNDDDSDPNEQQDDAIFVGLVISSSALAIGLLGVVNNRRRKRVHEITPAALKEAKNHVVRNKSFGDRQLSSSKHELTGYDIEQNRQQKNSSTEKVKDIGISIHWLKNSFFQEIEKLGLDSYSTVEDIEHKMRHTPFHAKSTFGAKEYHQHSFIDNIEAKGHIADANVMLGSCNSSVTLGDIIDTLWEYCASSRSDPKKTFIWISFLCHRRLDLIYNQKVYKSTLEREARIGKIITIVIPWAGPEHFITDLGKYEVYNAIALSGCKVEVVMTPSDRKIMREESIRNKETLQQLYKKIASIQALKNKATERIRDVVVSNRMEYNQMQMNFRALLLQWAKKEILIALKYHETQNVKDDLIDEYYAYLCIQAGDVMRCANEDEDVLKLYKKALKIYKNASSDRTSEIASLHSKIGVMLNKNGDVKGAIRQYKKSSNLNTESQSQKDKVSVQKAMRVSRSMKPMLKKRRRKYRTDRFPHP